MEYIQLKEIVDIYLGLTHTPKYVEKGIPFLSVKNISDGKIDFSNCHYITEEEYENLPKGARPQKGDMLFCRIGTIGKPIIIDENTRNFGSFVSLGFFRKKSNGYLLEYLKYWMNSQLFEKQVKQNVKGVAQINLNTGWLKEFILPKKSINEQIIIVNELNTIQKIIDIRKKQTEQLNELIKSQFVEMFGIVELNDKKFVEKEIDNIAEISSSKRIYANEYQDKGIPFYRSKEIIELGHNKKPSIELFISEKRYKEIKEKYGVPKSGDILITAVGTIGETWIVDNNSPFYYKDGNVLQIRLNKDISQIYFKYVLDILISIFKEKNVLGSAYSALTIEKFKKMKIILPPIDLQNKFAEFVKQIDKQKFEIQKSLEEIQKLQESLMNKYFGG